MKVSLFFVSLFSLISISVFAENSYDFGQDVMKSTGTQRLLVILAEHSNKNQYVHDNAHYRDLIFGFNHRSVNEFFRQNSQGKFFWLPLTTVPVFGPYNVTRTNSTNIQDAIHNGIKAFKNSNKHFNFSDYDKNNDKIITNDEFTIFMIDNWTDVWGAQRSTCNESGVCIKEDGVTLKMKVVLAGHRASLMTISHELSHILGAVDLYGALSNRNGDLTTMDATVDLNDLDNMDSYHLDPWHKMALGWINPKVFDMQKSGSFRLYAPSNWSKYNSVILYDSKKGKREFFMIEYRNRASMPGKTTFDETAADTGLIIWRVNLKADRTPDWYQIVGDSGDYAIFALGAPDFAKGISTAWQPLTLTRSLVGENGVSWQNRINVHNEKSDDLSILFSWFNTDSVQVPGCITDLAVGQDDNVWALDCNNNGDGNFYVRQYNPTNNNWLLPNMTGVRISVDVFGKDPWVVKKDGTIYHLTGGKWTKVSGCASDIAVGAFGKVFILGCKGRDRVGFLRPVFKRSNNQWVSMNFSGTSIETDASGNNPWVIGFQGSMHRYDGSSKWEKIDGCTKGLTFDKFGKGYSVSCTEASNGSYLLRQIMDDLSFEKVGFQAKMVAAKPDGKGLWLVLGNGNIYKTK